MAAYCITKVLLLFYRLQTGSTFCSWFYKRALQKPPVDTYICDKPDSKLRVAYTDSDLFSILMKKPGNLYSLVSELKYMLGIQDLLRDHLSKAFNASAFSMLNYFSLFHKVSFTPVGCFKYPENIPSVIPYKRYNMFI